MLQGHSTCKCLEVYYQRSALFFSEKSLSALLVPLSYYQTEKKRKSPWELKNSQVRVGSWGALGFNLNQQLNQRSKFGKKKKSFKFIFLAQLNFIKLFAIGKWQNAFDFKYICKYFTTYYLRVLYNI